MSFIEKMSTYFAKSLLIWECKGRQEFIFSNFILLKIQIILIIPLKALIIKDYNFCIILYTLALIVPFQRKQRYVLVM